jgi:hypothetical protein
MGTRFSTPAGNLHYKAGGTSVELTPHADVIGVDTRKLSGKVGTTIWSALKSESVPVVRGIALVSVKTIPNELAQKLRGLNAFLPVFESGGALLVPLPEVRVEGPTGKDIGKALVQARRWLQGQSDRIKVIGDGAEGLIVQLASGHGEDAVALADEISNNVSRVTATPRFIRWTQHPTLVTRA